MKYLLKTPYPCLIKTQNETVELDCNDTLECEDEQILYVYPTTPDQVPFCVNFLIKKDCPYYSFFKHNDKNILYLESNEKFNVFRKEELNFSGKKCKIFISKNQICFETDKQVIKCLCSKHKSSPKVFKIKDYACVQLEQDFFAYSMKVDKLSHFCGDEIAFDNGLLTVTKKYHDSLCREKITQYEISEEISIKQEQMVSSQSQKLQNNALISYKFLECVKANDFAQTKQYLSENLNQKIGEEQIKSFFGHLSDFLPLSANEFLAISNAAKKYVTFDLLNGKINDISIDEL